MKERIIYDSRIHPPEAMRMEIAVCVKLTYDVQELKADSSGAPMFQNVPIKISEFDKYAIEAAVKLKEGMGGCVRMFSVSNPNAKEAIKEALARGCGYTFAFTTDNRVDAKFVPDELARRAAGSVA
jgi:electron transfer flavoprotein alpha/beta subunit